MTHPVGARGKGTDGGCERGTGRPWTWRIREFDIQLLLTGIAGSRDRRPAAAPSWWLASAGSPEGYLLLLPSALTSAYGRTTKCSMF